VQGGVSTFVQELNISHPGIEAESRARGVGLLIFDLEDIGW
jgi:hypothetical protein